MVMTTGYDYEPAELPHAPAGREEWDARARERLYCQRQYFVSYALQPRTMVQSVRYYKPSVRHVRDDLTEERPGPFRRMGQALLRRLDTRPEPYGDLPASVDDQLMRIAQRLAKIKKEAVRVPSKK
jgi:hypothetical protein